MASQDTGATKSRSPGRNVHHMLGPIYEKTVDCLRLSSAESITSGNGAAGLCNSLPCHILISAQEKIQRLTSNGELLRANRASMREQLAEGLSPAQ
jgi:hypothetical protein